MLTDTTKYNVIDSITDRAFDIEFLDNNIIHLKLKDHIEITREDIKRQLSIIKSKTEGIHKYLFIVESGIDTTISKEAREFSSKPESNEMVIASAVIVKSLAQKMLINFIIKFAHQHPSKMKMFDDKQKAMTWLLSF